MYYIYILYSAHADKYYVGHSSNPWNRIIQHNTNKIEKYTGKYKDWKIRAVFAVSEIKGLADKIEKWIKRQKSIKLIETLIAPDFVQRDKLAHLVRVPNPSSRD